MDASATRGNRHRAGRSTSGGGTSTATTTSSSGGHSKNSSSLVLGGAGGSGSSNQANTAMQAAAAAAAAAAANSLQLLLTEDPALLDLLTPATSSSTTDGSVSGETSSPSPDDPNHVVFAYAAKLLHDEQEDNVADGSTVNSRYRRGHSGAASITYKERADRALQDVERKLALVESLAVKLSRTRPEAVAGHLLQLHGYDDPSIITTAGSIESHGIAEDSHSTAKDHGSSGGGTAATLTLTQIRDRSDRLERQAQVLDGVAQRVETSVARGATRLQATCTRLERVLETSSTLKSLLKLTFEANKLLGYDTDDVRDLIRAASSTAIVEDLLLELPVGIAVVEQMRPQLLQAGTQVRQAAEQLLQQQWQSGVDSSNSNSSLFATAPNVKSLSQLGAILQVYYSLHELPDAVWRSIEHSHQQAEQITRQLLQNATSSSVGGSSSHGGSGSSNRDKKKRQARSEASQLWSQQMANVCLQVWNLQRVLASKSDPTTRQWFVQVVNEAPVPTSYKPFVATPSKIKNRPTNSTHSIWALFWSRYCDFLSQLLQSSIPQKVDHNTAHEDVAALYPSLRAASMELVGRLQETPAWDEAVLSSSALMSTGTGGAGGGSFGGQFGGVGVVGSLGGGQLDDPFLEWTTGSILYDVDDNPQAAGSTNKAGSRANKFHAPTSADTWTQPSNSGGGGGGSNKRNSWLGTASTSSGTVATSAVLTSTEWKILEQTGLHPLQQAFVKACLRRLYEPLQYMFPEQTVTLDDDGVGVSAAAATGMTLLPSKYDIQRFDENIRQELSLADPRREGGGDLTLVTMVAGCVCDMMAQFCERAKTAVSSPSSGDESNLILADWNMSDSMQHDRKVAAIMHATAKYLKIAGEKTFVAPYRPAVYPQHEEAARICQAGLEPALLEIEKMVKQTILYPLSRAINRRILTVFSKMHHGVYIDTDDAAPSFVQKHVTDALEKVGQNVLARFPPEYATIVSSRVAAFAIYSFVSNAALLRPLGENARLHVTQDLADLELSLEQLVVKNGGSQSLSHMVGKAYAELRAVRQMLFWTGLEDSKASAQEVTKSLLREVWMKDVRPSTVLHYLYSFAPRLLSSPHHAKRMKAEDYVTTLVKLDGSVQDGDDAAWMTTMSCCDSYQQRASSVSASDGDARVPQILILLGQELMRRRQSVTNLS